MTVKLLLAASLRVWTVLVTAFGIAGLFLMKASLLPSVSFQSLWTFFSASAGAWALWLWSQSRRWRGRCR